MKKKKTAMTLDHLARMSQNEFTAIREEIGGVRGEVGIVREDIKILRNDMEAGFHGLSMGMKTIIERLDSIQSDVIELHDLRSRIERIEKKIGLRS